jgi:hypothetical protein
MELSNSPLIKSNPIKSKKEDDKEKINNEEKINEKNITVLNCIKDSWLMWAILLFSIVIISYKDFNKGLFTFIIISFIAYASHLGSHYFRNVFTIIHHYHHENNNLFAYYSQILLEVTLPIVFLPLYLKYDNVYIDPWIVLFFVLVYSSVHNINYAIFRVNDVHALHHKEIKTNIGPDIFDVIFNTKNKNNNKVENTNHYIPNIIITTILVVIIKTFAEINKNIYSFLKIGLIYFYLSSVLFLSVASIYLYIKDLKSKKKDVNLYNILQDFNITSIL